MASYASRRYDTDANGSVVLRETEEERGKKERQRCAKGALARMGRKTCARMSAGGWKIVGGRSVHVHPRGTIIEAYLDDELLLGVVTEDRVVDLDGVPTRWYTVTYQDNREEELDDDEIGRYIYRRKSRRSVNK